MTLVPICINRKIRSAFIAGIMCIGTSVYAVKQIIPPRPPPGSDLQRYNKTSFDNYIDYKFNLYGELLPPSLLYNDYG